MWDWIVIGIRIITFACGLLLIYVAIFLYEDEQGKIQNTLEDWWVKIDDLKRGALSRHTIFMQETARITNYGFNQLFGKKLVSLQALAVSACFSIASLGLAGLYMIYESENLFSSWLSLPFANEPLVALLWLLMFLGIALIPSRWPSLSGLVLGVSALSSILFFALFWHNLEPNVFEYSSYCFGIVLGIASDMLFIALTRKLLRWSLMEKFSRILTVILLNCLLSFVLIKGFYRFSFSVGQVYNFDFSTLGNLMHIIDFAFLFAAGTNFFTVLFALAIVILALIMLLHRTFWPMLSRPIYALAKLGIIHRPKLLGTIGLALLGLATGIAPVSLKDIVDKFIRP
jgi:hypothetical protein